MRVRFFPVFLSALFVLSQACMAEDVPQPQKPERQNKKPAPPVDKKEAPTVITADKVEAKQSHVLEATGKAEIRKGDQLIQADHFLYLQDTNEIFADGSVNLEQTGAKLTGPSLKMNLNDSKGEMVQPEFTFSDTNLRGSAELMQIESKQKYNFEHSIYTSCPVGNNDWLLRMSDLELDRNTQVGTAYHARVEFLGVPILYTPWMDFPLNDQRRSGMLGPVLGNTNTGGKELTLPFYWNISNNYDATFSPKKIEKRGTLYDNEFRYMGNSYAGTYGYSQLSNDKLLQMDRTNSSLTHTQNFGLGFGGSLILNQASDDAYFRDLSSNPAIATQKNLLNEAAVSYAGGGWWTTSIRAQSYQTLQDPSAPVALPYQRLPQLNLGAQRVLGGATATFNAEYVDFVHPTTVNGTRVVLYPSVSYPLVNDPAYYITPKIGVHSTQYSLGINNPGAESTFQRTLPILSLDSGMTLERDFAAYEHEYVQTLEPRMFFVKIPYQNQDQLPNFDSAPAAFSFMQMFTENRFIGSDRIGDAEQVTAALSSRLLDSDTGNELLRVTVGERFSRVTPLVVLGAPTTSTNQSDILLSVGGKMSNSITLDSLWQYNPNESRTEMFAATARYRPEAGKVVNLGYHYTFSADPDPTKTLKQIDLSTQWPLSGRWNMVGQLQYSLQESRPVQVLAGLEYSKECWGLRFVGQQFAVTGQEVSTSYFLQLELYEMLRVGTDPLAALKQSIPGYTVLSDTSNSKPWQKKP
jgi:LPS-assembly protein